VIRIDQLWQCTAPMDMRAGAERLMSCVVQTTGAARAHHGYVRVLVAESKREYRRIAVQRGVAVFDELSSAAKALAGVRSVEVGGTPVVDRWTSLKV